MSKQELNCDDEGTCEVPAANYDEVTSRDVRPSSKHKLLYFGDPMCSWCWGITNHLDQVIKDYADDLDFELILGGLRPGGGDEWNEETKDTLRTHWNHVHEASGQPFDHRFFDQKEFDYDTEPPSRAVRVIRDIAPHLELEFYKSLQSAFYAENRDIHDLKVLEEICNSLSIDYSQFESLFLSQGYKQLVYQDFARSQQLGVRGFPAVVLLKGDEYIAVTMGYSNYKTMDSRIKQILDY